MAEEGFKRKLTTILSADVVGYSHLMEDNEDATIQTLNTYRNSMSTLVQQHRGRVVDMTGDNLMAEFSSVVDAVKCAVETQKEISKRNADLPENRRMLFRIGVNLGDIVEEGDRIYGDGVNIAARLEGLAEGGGICISGTPYDQLKNKLELRYHYLGEHSVKNIATPVRVYKILMEPEAVGKIIGEKSKTKRWVAVAAAVIILFGLAGWYLYIDQTKRTEPASLEKMAFRLPDKPSIAVLPFDNMSEDPKQEYFCDGLTDQIISGLSKIPNIFVIARNSTFTYKGKPVKVQKVAEDLGVRYVMEGSVQRTADRIRITVQLIDATTGNHVWSERYDREPKDIFAIQDDITLNIIKAMRVEISAGEQARHWLKHTTDNLEVFEKMLQARSERCDTKASLTKARQLWEEVIALDPGFVGAYVGLGWTHFIEGRFGWSESRAKSMKMAFRYGQKAIALDDTFDWSHILLASVYLVTRQHEKSLAEAERAVALNPNGANAYAALAGIVGCIGRWEESVVLAKKAIRLNPFPSNIEYHWLGRAYFMTAQYDEAVITFKKALNVNPHYLPAHAFLASCYSSLGSHAEAAAEANEVLRINPKFTLESYARTLPYKNKADIERYVTALRKAGLK